MLTTPLLFYIGFVIGEFPDVNFHHEETPLEMYKYVVSSAVQEVVEGKDHTILCLDGDDLLFGNEGGKSYGLIPLIFDEVLAYVHLNAGNF